MEGALFVDLNTQLATIDPDLSKGGRHPLPSTETFSQTLAFLGISSTGHIVIYDDKDGSNAEARFWWMLRAIGQEKVQVFDGGFQAAVRNGFTISSTVTTAKKSAPYPIGNWLLPQADILEVKRISQDQNHLVIDVRDHSRYLGENEPIDLSAGHIRGAINIPLSNNLNGEGEFLSPAELREKYSGILKNILPQHVIVHCGSGVTACHTLLAMDYAGLEIPKLYLGSWSEWSRNQERPQTCAGSNPRVIFSQRPKSRAT